MSCARCPLVVATGQLNIPAEAVEAEPALALLCVEHFAEFLSARGAREARKLREASRVWCACGNEILFQVDGQPCQRCLLLDPFAKGFGVPGGSVSIRVDESWYRTAACDIQPCETKLVYRLPSGETLCVQHGAPDRGGRDVAGRS